MADEIYGADADVNDGTVIDDEGGAAGRIPAAR